MNNEQHQARMDGEQDAETDVSRILWIVVGFFVNVIGVLIAYVYQPSLPHHVCLKSHKSMSCFTLKPIKIRQEVFK